MELLKLSKFKLLLQDLIRETRVLRESERTANEHVNLLAQKQKQTEEEHSRKLQELQAELASSNELRVKLEKKVDYLQNDIVMLENNQKELKDTINRLLQSRESFINAYEESTCDMKRSIETRDRKLHVLSEKINSHLILFDSIEKEASCIKQVVDNVERLVSEKEEVVASLKSKMDKVSEFEKVFLERIDLLESKLKNNEDEFRRKDKIISELEAELEAAKISNSCEAQIEELQKNVFAKDMILRNLTSEKEALLLEVSSLGIILQRIQDAVANMNQEDNKIFSAVLQQQCDIDKENDGNRLDDVQETGETPPTKGSTLATPENRASPPCQEYISISSQLQENNNVNSGLSEFACSPPCSALSAPESASKNFNITTNNGKDNCPPLYSECSMTQAETSNIPGAKA